MFKFKKNFLLIIVILICSIGFFIILSNIIRAEEEKPDLTVTNILISPENPEVNKEVIITVIAKNVGKTDITSGEGKYNYYHAFASFKIEHSTLPTAGTTIKPTEEFYYIFKGYFVQAGDKILTFTIDNTDELSEINETNNTFERVAEVKEVVNGEKSEEESKILVVWKSTLAKKIGNNYLVGAACPKDYKLFSIRCENLNWHKHRDDIYIVNKSKIKTDDGRQAGYCQYKAEHDSVLGVRIFCAKSASDGELYKDKIIKKSTIKEDSFDDINLITVESPSNNYIPTEIKCTSSSNTPYIGTAMLGNNNKAMCQFFPEGADLTIEATFVDFYPELEYSKDIKMACEDGVCPTEEIVKINNRANLLYQNKLSQILSELQDLRDIAKEQQTQIKYLAQLKKDAQQLSQTAENALNTFITYGADDNTKKLGAGERAAVIHSFKSAFKKLPETEDELADVIKIANGRWPSQISEESEKRAKEQFQKIYKKIADPDNLYDNAAITIMTYGLRQKAGNRNLNSERQGIQIFKHIYDYHPTSAEDWNIMQAITYSGASRGIDTDRDLLIDEREVELSTDPNNPDSDDDGYLDGVEVSNGYNPLGSD